MNPQETEHPGQGEAKARMEMRGSGARAGASLEDTAGLLGLDVDLLVKKVRTRTHTHRENGYNPDDVGRNSSHGRDCSFLPECDC